MIVLLILLQGSAKFFRDARLWHLEPATRLAKWIHQRNLNWPTWMLGMKLWLLRWYVGGNKKYNPRLLGDWWHFWDAVYAFTWVIAGIMMYEWYWYFILHYSAQKWFTIQYHYLDPMVGHPDRWSFAKLLRHLINPFI